MRPGLALRPEAQAEPSSPSNPSPVGPAARRERPIKPAPSDAEYGNLAPLLPLPGRETADHLPRGLLVPGSPLCPAAASRLNPSSAVDGTFPSDGR